MDRGVNVPTKFARLKIESVPRTGHLTDSAFSPRNGSPSGGHAHIRASPISMQSVAIPIPRLELDHHHDSLENGGSGSGSGLNDDHPGSYKPSGGFMEKANRQRKSSISFDPQVKTDSGKQIPLQGPLPRAIKPDGSTKKQYFQQRAPVRSYTWSENDSQSSQGNSLRYRNGQFGYGDGNGNGSIRRRPQNMDSPGPDQMSSLTSDSTMSPMSEDFRTPPPTADPFGLFFPSSIASSPLNEDEQENSFWSSPRRLSSSRNKSFSSLDGRTRSRSRRSSIRSSSPMFGEGSSQLSPANLFLNNFNTASSQPTEPDSEGQEVGSYVLGKQVGFGGFSVVKEAITIEDGMEITRAVKIVRKRVRDVDCENDQIQAEFDHEVSLWRCLSHPNILPLVAVYDTPFATFAFMRLNQGGTLHDLIKLNRKGLSARLAQKYAFQLSCALRYLHEDMRIIHRDVKLENCLVDMSVDVDEGGNLQLCDFGMAEFMRSTHEDEDDDSDSSGNAFTLDPRPGRRSRRKSSSASSTAPVITSTPVGSLEYAPPEVLSDKGPTHYTMAVDMWAFGVVVYTLFTGTLPFSHKFQPKLQSMILKGEWNVDALKQCRGLAEAGREETNNVLEVVKGCLTMNVEDRWDIRAVLESRWFEELGVESP